MTTAQPLSPPPPEPLNLVQCVALALATPAAPGADPVAAIVSAEPAHARLRFYKPGGHHASILSGGVGLEAALAETIAGWKEGVLHVLVLGADRKEVQQLWKRHAPFWQLKRIFSLHVSDAAGKVRTVVGAKLPPLQAGFDRARMLDGASLEVRERLQAVQAADARATQDVVAFQQTLRGRKVAATTALVIACFAVFGAELALFHAPSTPQVLIRMGAMQGELLLRGQWWRLLAPSFLHMGPWHVLLNMVALFSLGSLLERLLGWRRFLLLFAACGLGSSAAILVATPEKYVVGASGAIWGLMAFEFFLAFRPGGLFPEIVAKQLKSAAPRLLAINVGISLLPGISLAAHLGGGLVGLALAASGLLTRGVRPVAEEAPPPPSRALTAGGALSAIALVASLAAAIAWGRPWDFAEPELTRVELAEGFVATMPAVRARLEERSDNGVISTTFGDIYTDGAVYRVLLIPAKGVVADTAEMDALKAELAKQALAGIPRLGRIEVKELGGRTVVVDQAASGLNRVREWSTYRDDHLVILQVVEPSNPGQAPWEALAPNIFLSIGPH